MTDRDADWQGKGATLSDKTATKEFGLTRDEIVQAIRAGKLRYQEASMHGNPWLQLLRREVEALVKKEQGDSYLKESIGSPTPIADAQAGDRGRSPKGRRGP